MTDIVVSRFVDRVTIVSRDDKGQVTANTIYDKDSGKKKQSKSLRPVERLFRRLATAQANAAITYLDRHHRSNRKKKDGWARDVGKNLMAAQRKGLKKSSRVVALPSSAG